MTALAQRRGRLVAGHATAPGVDAATLVHGLGLPAAPGIDPTTRVSGSTDGERGRRRRLSRPDPAQEAPKVADKTASNLGVPRLDSRFRRSFPSVSAGGSEGEREDDDGCSPKISHDRFLSLRLPARGLHGHGGDASLRAMVPEIGWTNSRRSDASSLGRWT